MSIEDHVKDAFDRAKQSGAPEPVFDDAGAVRFHITVPSVQERLSEVTVVHDYQTAVFNRRDDGGVDISLAGPQYSTSFNLSPEETRKVGVVFMNEE